MGREIGKIDMLIAAIALSLGKASWSVRIMT
jgi:hypothetical protein